MFTMKTDATREQTLQDTADLFQSGKTAAVLRACDHVQQDVRNKQRALEYLETHCAGRHARKVAELLATTHVQVDYETTVSVEPVEL